MNLKTKDKKHKASPLMQKLLPLLIIFLISNLSFSQISQNLESKIDSLIQTEFNNSNEPGGAFLISHNGKPIYKKAFGLANLELEVKMTPDNVFQIGSMTKQFTAVAILMLEEQGKLSVNDPISKFIPDYPNGKNITVSHLLTHTSGIKDFTKMKTIFEIAQKEMTPKEMMGFFKEEPVDFSPGEKFEYNNSGYIVLGYLIELTAGKTYEEFIQKNIFDKIGMKNSYYASDRKVITNRAYGYHKKSYGFVNKTVISFSVPFSSGSLMSTLDDMLKWQNALNPNVLLQPENLTKAFTRQSLSNSEKIEYGYGWHLKNEVGIPTREHGGSIFGFKSMGVYIPSKDIYVLGLSNCDCHSPTQIVRDLTKLIGEKTRE
jgi:CubicO group peptidase (beta-lactamase class C family)